MNCLWCHDEMIIEIDWKNLFIPPQPSALCVRCAKGLDELTGNRCQKCSRITDDKVCKDCLWWEEYSRQDDPIDFNYSVFTYNNMMKAIIAKWKYRGDYQLGYVFQKPFTEHFRKVFTTKKGAIVVPIPLSEERINERCFNQAMMLASFLPFEMVELLSRIHGEKQSKKSRYERLSTQNPFIIKESVNKPVILVDDIYTTGTTLRHAAELLKKNGCPIIYTYTLVRG
ncbi:ComF family protein [Ornithinibacillus xuwenensis]|uniref:ComF family protein n=1 Tax=Ornithinibacillus xuwenensis TaxID=3144668 RepID=A0ABU9XKC8_9BACI